MTDPVISDTNRYLAKEEAEAKQQEEAEAAATSRMYTINPDEIGEAMKVMGNRIRRVGFFLLSESDDAELGRLVREIVEDYLYADELSGLENQNGD